MRRLLKNIKLSSFQIIIIGFLGVILVGTLLLMLPFAVNSGKTASFFDALFTSTSAVCVTGLIVQDTATYWSAFGQFIIIILIQTGGMGIVTVALSVAMVSGKKIGLMQRSTMQEQISAPKVGGIVKMTSFILKGVLLFELIGTILLATVFVPEFGIFKGLWYALFHSVSAFCNAGFDLIGIKEQFSSLTSYARNPVINLTVMMLIVIGGIGFFTWEDVLKNKWRIHKYRMQTKTILATTLILILIPAVYFFFCEFSDKPFGERIWISFFQSVTMRTAGFNTTNLISVSEVGLTIMIVLMIIGGSPGSTAGGMKTTTLAVLFSSAVSVFKRRDNAHLFNRRIDDSSVKSAIAVLLMYITLFLGGGMIICAVENISLITALYETASAIGTVGLSLGITPNLCGISKFILIVLMFFGRVGGLTLIFATVSEKGAKISKYPLENITVG